MRRLLVLLVLIAPVAFTVEAQTPRFTIDDMLGIVTTSVLDLSPDGRWLAVTVTTHRDRLGQDYSGDPTYLSRTGGALRVIDTRNGTVSTPLAADISARAARWSPDGSQLLIVALKPRAEVLEAVIWNRATGRVATVPVPRTHYVAETGERLWMPDGKEVVLALRSYEWRQRFVAGYQRLVNGPIVRMSSRDPFLGWEEQSRLGQERSVVAIDPVRGTARDLIPEGRSSGASVADDGARIIFSRDTLTKTPYARLSVPALRDARVIVPAGDPRAALAERQVKLELDKKTALSWTRDGQTYVYGREGRIFVGSLASGPDAERQIAGPPRDTARADRAPAPAAPVPDSVRERRAKENFTLTRLDPSGAWLLATNSEGFWEIETASGNRNLVVRSDTAAGTPRFQFTELSKDGGALFFTSTSREQWEQGIYRYDRAARRLETLVKDANRYSGLRVSEDGATLVFTKAEGARPGDLYVMAGTGGAPRRLTTTNTTLADPAFSRTELVSYFDMDGRRQFGVLYYPTDYRPGERYPTIFHLYEQFFNEEFEIADKLLGSNGYVIFRPSVPTRTDPGYVNESWLKGATAAANKLIEMGVADSARLGVYGCSYGGFATSLLVTQTHRFKAAIAIAPPTNMFSFYTESPRMGMRNMAFHEGRGQHQLNIASTPWEQPQKYLANSAVMGADRVQTPLLILSGGQDHNVPVGQSAELFYALRRLGKEVEWVNYVHGGHCTPYTTESDFRDYHQQILGWFDRYLKKEATP